MKRSNGQNNAEDHKRVVQTCDIMVIEIFIMEARKCVEWLHYFIKGLQVNTLAWDDSANTTLV